MDNENIELMLFAGATDVNVNFAEKFRCIYDYLYSSKLIDFKFQRPKLHMPL